MNSRNIDFGSMKHINLKIKSKIQYNVGDIIVSIEGNNFGDQILHFRRYSELSPKLMDGKEFKVTGFELIESIMNCEGQHWDLKQMKGHMTKRLKRTVTEILENKIESIGNLSIILKEE